VRFRGEIWRQRPWIWVPALVFFLANATAFSVYKLGYAGQVEQLDDDIHTQQQTIQKLNGDARKLNEMIDLVRTNQEQVQQLYAERLSTRSRRLTGITREVKELATQAGMTPRSLSYPEEQLQDYNLIKRSFVFSVQGTYPELRKLVHLLEASRSFISIEEVTVAGNSEGPELKIDLTLSTLFAQTSEDGAAAVPTTPTTRTPAAPGTSGGAS
jgi:Tfp pilus assembly protein PilO